MKTDNRLIGEFLSLNPNGKITYPFKNELELNAMSDADLEAFETSYRWIMPVVFKVNRFCDCSRPFKFGLPESTSLIIKGDKVVVKSMMWSTNDPASGTWIKLSKTIKMEQGNEIKAIHKAVVVFIKWYNLIIHLTNAK